MMKIKAHILAVWIVVIPIAVILYCDALDINPSDDVVLDTYGRIAKNLARKIPHYHLLALPFNDFIATNALEYYVETLDSQRSFFLASDIAAFQKQANQIDDQLKNGDLKFGIQVFNTFMMRVSNRVDYVKFLLDQGFDLEKEENFIWDRQEAQWSVNENEWNELWRKKIKNEYIAAIVTRHVSSNMLAGLEMEPDEKNEQSEQSEAPPSPEEQILERYKQFYIVFQDNDREAVLERYLNAFVRAYDHHSQFMSPFTKEDFDISMRLSLVGIGALLTSEDGAAKVVRLIPGGPAEQDGELKPNDKIIAVAQGDEPPVSILHWPLNKAVRLIRGEKNTKVVLTVIPASDPTSSTTRKIIIVRDEVKLEGQAAKKEIREVKGQDGKAQKIGYIILPEFYIDFTADQRNENVRSCSKDVRRLLEEVKQEEVDGVVFDLRNDGGGALKEAVEIAGLFIPKGPVVQVKGQYRYSILSDTDNEVVYDGPLLILVNRQSASASEILAGAMQDYGRALIVGDSKTHGKGTVQAVLPLHRFNSDLGSLKVTTDSFYRITGGSTQLKGIAADIVIPSSYDVLEIGEEYLPNALQWSQINPAAYEPSFQLRKQLPELRKRSLRRRQVDARFTAHEVLLQRLKKKIQADTLSLKLDDRLQLHHEERELERLRNQYDRSQDDDEEGSGPNGDLMLDEALKIMADMIELNEKSKDTIAVRDDSNETTE